MHSFQFPSRKGIRIGCHLRWTALAKHNHSPPQARLAISFFQPSSLQAWRPWPWLSWPCTESHAESLYWWKHAGQTGEQDAPCSTMGFNQKLSRPFQASAHSTCAHSHSPQVCTPHASIPTLGLPLMTGCLGGRSRMWFRRPGDWKHPQVNVSQCSVEPEENHFDLPSFRQAIMKESLLLRSF